TGICPHEEYLEWTRIEDLQQAPLEVVRRHGLRVDAIGRPRQHLEDDRRGTLPRAHRQRWARQRELHVDGAAHVSRLRARIATDPRRRTALLRADERRDTRASPRGDRGGGRDRRGAQVRVGANVEEIVVRVAHERRQFTNELRRGDRPAVEHICAGAVDVEHDVASLLGPVAEVLADGDGEVALRERGRGGDDGCNEAEGVSQGRAGGGWGGRFPRRDAGSKLIWINQQTTELL